MAGSKHTKAPAFQFYPKDFLSDSRQMAMSLAEAGAYIRLLCYCWNDGFIPDDPARLARIIGATKSQMQKLWPALRQCFREQGTNSGRLIHPRLEIERRKQREHSADKSEAGKKGAEKRWHGHNKSMAQPSSINGTAIDEPLAKNSSSSSSAFASASTSTTPERGSTRLAFGGKVLQVPKFLDAEFVARLNGQFFDLSGFYLALDSRLAQTGEPWDLAWIRRAFDAESPKPSKRARQPQIATGESWTCAHEPKCHSAYWCKTVRDAADAQKAAKAEAS